MQLLELEHEVDNRMWVRLIACANGNAVDCVTRDGESIYAIARIVCVCVPCVFHYVHSGTYLGLWWGYGVRICFFGRYQFPLYFKRRERERRYWGHLSFFNLMISTMRFMLSQESALQDWQSLLYVRVERLRFVLG